MTMRGFLRFSALYLMCAVPVAWLVRPGAVGLAGLTEVLSDAFANLVVMSIILIKQGVWLIVPFLAVLFILVRPGRDRALMIGQALLGVLLLQAGFALVKGSIPLIVPFWADPHLAAIDAALHGHDPWLWAYTAPGWITALALRYGPVTYASIWTIPALFLPLVAAATDNDPVRVRRLMGLYVFCWFGIGTVLAIGFSSAGPVFFDKLLHSDRFAGLDAVLTSSGLGKSVIGMTQAALWHGYSLGNAGSGISAFPSVHLSIATLTAIYMGERYRALLPFGVLFVLAIFFMSIFTGYHYAVDGYTSIAFVTLAWAVARRWQRAGTGQDLTFDVV